VDEPPVAPNDAFRARPSSFILHPSSFPSAFSLLEVIIALGIMAGAMVVLGELARAGLRHAEEARDLAEAEIVCESKLAEITSGLTQPTSVGATSADTPLGDSGTTPTASDQGKWMYAVDVSPVDGQEGLLVIKVTVSLAQDQQGSAQDKQGGGGKTSVTLTRWMIDPNSTSSSSNSSSGSNSNSSSSGSSSGGSSSQNSASGS
jgi:type II secretory pathway pseudopilin PulG